MEFGITFMRCDIVCRLIGFFIFEMRKYHDLSGYVMLRFDCKGDVKLDELVYFRHMTLLGMGRDSCLDF